MVNPNRFYTYAYLREDRTPYYIGKGNGNRISDSRRSCYSPKDKSKIIFLKQNLTEEEAFRHEIYMIAVFGRKDLETGILHIRTDGGDGVSGYKHSEKVKEEMSRCRKGKNNPNFGKTHTQEARDKISSTHKGKKFSDELKRKLSELRKGRKGKPHNEETKKKISESQKGKIIPDEVKKKISETLKDRKFSEEHRKKIIESNRGKKRSEEFKNRLKKIASKRNIGKRWWNNGRTNKFCVECPGDEWIRGMIKKSKEVI